eukprot:3893748-Prymnesium_polylepis.2
MLPPTTRRLLTGGLLAAAATVPLVGIAPPPPAAAVAGSPLPRLPRLPPPATFGVQVYDDDAAERYTQQALEAGFRSFFTSPEAGNQRGFARAIRDSGVPRDELVRPAAAAHITHTSPRHTDKPPRARP